MNRSALLTPTRLLATVTFSILAVSACALADDDAADQAMATIRAVPIRANMSFLADDLLEGRGTGSRGHQVAAMFMATRFEAMGLIPAGDAGSFLQRIPLRLSKPDASKESMLWVRAGKAQALTVGEDYLLRADPIRQHSDVQAPVVFVGFGVTAPEQQYDDYKGLNARGKIVVVIYGAPKFESAIAAHYTSPLTKAKNAAAHGAVGLIVIDDPKSEKSYPWPSLVRDTQAGGLHWLDQQGVTNDSTPELRAVAYLSMRATHRLFEGSQFTAAQVFDRAKLGSLKSFALPLIVNIHSENLWSDAESANVVAKLEGTDPELKNQYLVYTAHLDHLGIGVPVNGDAIYNGALDNASGAAILLEVARAFGEMKPRPRRSILFISATGEEVGLLGSSYFTHHPTVAEESIVADLDVDTDFMLWPMQDILAFGIEHSTLREPIRQAAARLHLLQSPDPVPEEAIFIRGDNYSFVKRRIPSVALSPGIKSNDSKIDPMAILNNWLQTRYHQPQDDMQQPGLDFNEAAKFARFVFLSGYMITENPQRPAWNEGDFFGLLSVTPKH